MSNISKLTSPKNKLIYIIVYVTYSILYIADPLVIMKFIDYVLLGEFNKILIYACLSIILFLLIQVFSYFFWIIRSKVESDNFTRFFLKIDSNLQKYDLKRKNLSINDLNQAIGQNYEIANQYFFIQPLEFIFSVISIVVIFTIMFFINWKITIILICTIPLSFIVSKLFEKKLFISSEENLNDIINVKEYVTDQYKLTKEERLLHKKQLNTFNTLLEKFRGSYFKKNKTKAIYLCFFSYCFLNFSILLVILLSGLMTYKGLVSIGVLYAFQNYTSQLWTPGEVLMSYNANYQQVKPALKELEDLLSLKALDYSEEKIETVSLNNLVLLDKDSNPISEPINYFFEKGIHLITGENGCGKTTLIEAIMGYNDRISGEILINGSNVVSNDLVYISAVPYISNFFDSGSKKMSNGQKKIMQIHLCISTDKSLYVFDEPTNFLDDNNFDAFLKIIEKLKKNGKIIIIVSHDKKLLEMNYNTLTIKNRFA